MKNYFFIIFKQIFITKIAPLAHRFSNGAFFITYLSVACVSAQTEQPWTFQHFGYNDGLSQMQISDIMEDSWGFIWLNTSYGLKRFDGYSFKDFYLPETEHTVQRSSRITKLMEDSKGRIWIGTAQGLYLYDRSSDRFSPFFNDSLYVANYAGNHITALFEDSQERLWVGTQSGLFEFRPESGNAFIYVRPINFSTYNTIHSIAEDSQGLLWAGCQKYGLLLINSQALEATKQKYPANSRGPKNGTWTVYSLYNEPNGALWMGTEDGLWKRNSTSKHIEAIPFPDSLAYASVGKVIGDPDHHLWISLNNYGGLLRYEPQNSLFTHFQQSSTNSLGLNNNRVLSLEIDRFGYLWVGHFMGLDKVYTKRRRFQLYQQEPGLGHPANIIFNSWFDPQGGFWFTTYDSRLFYNDQFGKKPAKELLLNFNKPASFLTLGFLQDAKKRVWLANSSFGVYILNAIHDAPKPLDATQKYNCRFVDTDDRDMNYVWLGTHEGLLKINIQNFEKQIFLPKNDLPNLVNNQIISGIQCPDGTILTVLTDYSNGLLARFDKEHQHFEYIDIHQNLPIGQTGLQVRQMAFANDTVWLATASGLGKIDIRSNCFQLINQVQYLPVAQLMGIQSDMNGDIWMKSLQYITKYSPSTGHFVHFRVGPDMQEFNTVGSSQNNKGQIVFHGINGFYAFHPNELAASPVQAKLVLTGIKVLNQPFAFGKAVELVGHIKLKHSQNAVSLEYAYLNTANPAHIKYRYKMEGLEEEFSPFSSDRNVTYTNVPPGKYIFRVEAYSEEEINFPATSEDLAVSIVVLPPWYRTWWAYLAYVIALALLIVIIRRYELRRLLAQAEARHYKELDMVKSRLYTNITHEFRTPLTVILGMAEQVKNDPKTWFNEGLQLIKRNGQQLLHLVNQLLDLAKLEAGAMPLHYIHGNVIAFLRYLAESYHSFADSKDIRLHFLSELTELNMDYDPEKLQNIVANLLSNAIKFTPAGGNIYFSIKKLNDIKLEFNVKDTGIGISPENLPHIFNRFYQVDDSSTRMAEGTGIGLSLSKELVQLMGGEIYVESELGVGSRFSVILPIAHHFAGKEIINDDAPNQLIGTVLPDKIDMDAIQLNDNTGKRPLLLIIEDNTDVILYLQSLLSSQYEIISANNGRTGIEIAFEQIPDLIVSDVMMPEMDGFQVCETLKMDERTSHIPIILLTAKSTQASKIEGLAQGADAYLSKPFYKEELMVRIEKLIDNRRQLQQKYSQGNLLTITNTKAPTRDEIFLEKLVKLVEEHLSDENFGMHELCKHAAMSRTQLFRKLKALTGKSATRFIRTIRLEKARELLETTDMNISEIAFQTGFGSSAYFSRVFQEEYGMAPSSVRNL